MPHRVSGRPLSKLVSAAFLLLLPPGQGSAQDCDGGRLRVAVDVGHSRPVSGATSAMGHAEYDFNRRFADELVAASKASKALDLFLIDTTGRALSLGERPRRAADGKADVMLSIHHDSVNDKYIKHWTYEGRRQEYSDDFSGYSLFIGPQNRYSPDSLSLAQAIGRHLVGAGLKPTLHHAEKIRGENRKLLAADLGVYEAPFAVLRLATIPAVLFEVGIIVNRQDEAKLLDARYRAGIQAQVVAALGDYCATRTRAPERAAEPGPQGR